MLYETNRSSDFYAGFSTFLGVWYQVCIKSLTNTLSKSKKQTILIDRNSSQWEAIVQKNREQKNSFIIQ